MLLVGLYVHPPEGRLLMRQAVFLLHNAGELKAGARHLRLAGDADRGEPFSKRPVRHYPNPPRAQGHRFWQGPNVEHGLARASESTPQAEVEFGMGRTL